MARFYTVEKLGEKQSETPEGFLVCSDVAIARTGTMLYGEGEVPLDAKYGLIEVARDADEVFREETIASFEGKSVTIDHPEDFVNPDNFKELEVGTVQNVRRGTGTEDHLLIADLLIKDKQAIELVKKGLREVSCGYDADYEQVAAGKGVQRNIVGNHVALVDKGRCGSRCSIGDKEKVMPIKPKEVEKTKKVSFADRIRRAFMSKDAEAAEKLAQEAEDAGMDDDETETNDGDGDDNEQDSKTADALKVIMKQLKSMDADIKSLKAKSKDAESKRDTDETNDDDIDETTDGDGDLTEAEKAEKLNQAGVQNHTGDKAWKDLRVRTEILAAGHRLPTHDKKMSAKDSALALCKCKRRVLDVAYQTDDGKKAITPFLGGRTADFDRLPSATIDAAFVGASELIKSQNNANGVRSGISTRDFGRPPQTPAELNAKNRQFWNDRQPK